MFMILMHHLTVPAGRTLSPTQRLGPTVMGHGKEKYLNLKLSIYTEHLDIFGVSNLYLSRQKYKYTV